MKCYSVCSLFFAFAISICFASSSSAASLYGKVIEINDGDAITVFNLNRPVRVRLMGIDAPEKNQAFGDVAKQHLTDLIYEKFVTVEYSGLSQDGSLVGRVLLNDIDVGAQMIRDGVAWYDPNYKSRLTETELDVYFQSEQAARTEKRGLWQVDRPMPPWEFVKNVAMGRVVPVTTMQPTASSKRDRPTPELTSLGLLKIEAANGAMLGSRTSEIDRAAVGTSTSSWQRFQPTGENFSVLVPSEGKETKNSVPFGDQMIDVNYYMARDRAAVYALMWTTAPTQGETDAAAINATLSGFVSGVGAGYQGVGGKFSCEPGSERDVSLDGFSGREYDLKNCTIPAMARVYTKVTGSRRQMYIGAVFFFKDDPNVNRFLESFTVTSSGGKTRVKAIQ